ncbi:hypothetical protein SFBM_0329 [Candidatus Arthromitus sp. SFB-mouse-Japan]|uniref:hypothetical protein n=1 Tax=unclassified Candidatus Neoarthromitus TaxID=2638829 RepID=UPI00021B7DB9|nr:MULTISPECIES: hypothetical protein [unclassified Candidatus Arthromitus]EIA27898.1 hypothetical protein SFB4_155G4 [Candidatus Arthromitus sp. SFB-4]EIA29150.1 hypothetical protein SFB6_014G10 [Candidatus Arthromitus sp. SFB-co]EIA30375.1 hypothetical protein SFBSU_006G56 [Candidatus Arthromitus sp. SFB-mouse-SU]AID44270.1 Hypothetical protein SFBmNL_00351 [Candidatus Arthromitus sp. SFB-mouse-NL]EGX29222.1 hypothetical protein SFBNYU_012700 [Candidatus Arthromitus sp. SFB-mouse-NYU]
MIKYFFVIMIFLCINKFLIFIRIRIETKFKNNFKTRSIINRIDLIDYGVDYYLLLCKYIISKMKDISDIVIEDISGREVVDIKFNQNGKMVYCSCILKDRLENKKFDLVTYYEVLDLLNYMIKDNVNRGIIFVNSDLIEDASKFINDINLNSNKYKIDIVSGYDIIKFARKRNEEYNKELLYA